MPRHPLNDAVDKIAARNSVARPSDSYSREVNVEARNSDTISNVLQAAKRLVGMALEK